jgi:N-acetylglucosaminyldiphosphoundecaprenol N-acetyl-beta-D-mannosaminyltransferase
MKTKDLLSIKVSLGAYDMFVDNLIRQALSSESTYTCVANVHMVSEAYKSDSYADIMKKADMVTPDGKPLTWALKFLYNIRQERVAGMDLLPDLLSAAENHQIPVAFYGGTDEMLAKTKNHLKEKYPDIQLAKMYSPPFRSLTAQEENEVVLMLRESGARLIFVTLGCPKQEKWMASMKGKINAVMIGIGGALPVLIGMHKRAPKWMQKSGLEWLYRLGQEPSRLFRRYATSNTLFFYLLLKEKFRPSRVVR